MYSILKQLQNQILFPDFQRFELSGWDKLIWKHTCIQEIAKSWLRLVKKNLVVLIEQKFISHWCMYMYDSKLTVYNC